MKSKKIAALLLCMLMVSLLSGCWDYKGLNNLSIVAGMAVDENPSGEGICVSFELVDKASSLTEGPVKGTLITAQGETLADAVRSAEDRLINEMYFGNMQVLVISRQVAKKTGVKAVMEEVFREPNLRETIHVIISKEKTAADILKPIPDTPIVVSYEIKENIEQHSRLSASVRDIKAYEIYNLLAQGKENLVLPAFSIKEDEEKDFIEADGLALFREDILSDFFSTGETLYYLFIMNEVEGGIFTFEREETREEKVSLKIQDNETKRSFSYDGERLTIDILCKVNSYLVKKNEAMDAMDPKEIEKLEQEAAAALCQELETIISKAQQELELDVFDFSIMIYKNNYKVWQQVEEDWEQIFRDAEIRVSAEVRIENSGFIKNY